ncbi:MAG: hypothetical protein NTU81_00005, partial [Candidatus Nomurabacteria bacterium]|nr:hypothetical protein [Candidatus Nomurabacteria bacterium]
MKIIQNTDIKKLQETAALALKEALMDSHEDGVLLLLSAGSAFDILENISLYPLVFNNKITIGMLDERFDNSKDINNYIQFQKTNFYQRALDGGVNFIDSIPKENETIDSFSLRIEQSLRKWRSENKYGKIIITEGVG